MVYTVCAGKKQSSKTAVEDLGLEIDNVYDEPILSENQEPSRPTSKPQADVACADRDREIIEYSDYENDDYKPEEEIQLGECLAYGKLPANEN